MVVYHIWPDMCFWSLWDWGTNPTILLIVINRQTTIAMAFLNTYVMSYATKREYKNVQYSGVGVGNFGAYTESSFYVHMHVLQ